MILPNNGLGTFNPLDQFRTIVTQKGGFQSPSRYLINITPPPNSGIKSITAYPESITFPEQTINIIPNSEVVVFTHSSLICNAVIYKKKITIISSRIYTINVLTNRYFFKSFT